MTVTCTVKPHFKDYWEDWISGLSKNIVLHFNDLYRLTTFRSVIYAKCKYEILLRIFWNIPVVLG